jgi:hypothetical protein
MIAGDYNVPIKYAGTDKSENMAITIRSDCTFSSESPSTGKSYGTLKDAGNGYYVGSGKTPACPSGNFSVAVYHSILDGNIGFTSECN